MNDITVMLVPIARSTLGGSAHCPACGAQIGEVRLQLTGANSLRQDLLAALGEELETTSNCESLAMPANEASWRRGWNAKRQSMLEAINRLLPEEEG